uniref:Uncharacterized protein n=1 Tax=Oryza meridionalis TaxID=40149 RepID=A0A0E0DND4_9ORYZ
MEGKTEISSKPTSTCPASASGGAAASCEAGKTPSSGGLPLSAAASSEKRPGSGGGELPGWKLDCLCRESGMSAVVISGGFPCF